jgi:hypothetical protein
MLEIMVMNAGGTGQSGILRVFDQFPRGGTVASIPPMV